VSGSKYSVLTSYRTIDASASAARVAHAAATPRRHDCSAQAGITVVP